MRASAVGVIALAALGALEASPAEPLANRAPTLTGSVQAYEVRRGDTLRAIGARFGVDVATLAADNGIAAPDRLESGQLLEIDNRHIVPEGIVPGFLLVNVPQRMMFVLGADGHIEAFPVAVGRPAWQTPVSPFTVLTAEKDPTWDVPSSILEEARRAGRPLPAKVPPGPHNPLGEFWLGLTLHAIGIHGTNAPSSIYGAVTHGCIRMRPADIARVFASVAVGTRGRTMYAPVLIAEHEGEIFLEVHPDVYRLAPLSARAEAREIALTLGLTDRIDWDRADRTASDRHGVARAVGLRAAPALGGGRPSPSWSRRRGADARLGRLAPAPQSVKYPADTAN